MKTTSLDHRTKLKLLSTTRQEAICDFQIKLKK